MKVLAINGSPRKNGNTAAMLKAVLAPLEAAGIETEIFQAGGMVLRGCTGCRSCRKGEPRCIYGDDGLNEIVEKMVAADAIVIGSPTYFADVTTEIKAIMDRAGYCTLGRRQLSRKIGVAVTAVRRGGAIHVIDTINHFFMISGMIIPGSTYWNMAYGSAPGDVESDAEGMANMTDIGQTIAWLLPRLNRVD